MWKQIERFGVGFLVGLPFLLLWWVGKTSIHFGDSLFQELMLRIFGKYFFATGLLLFLLLCWILGCLFEIPYVGSFLQRALKKIPFVGAFIQRKEAFKNIKKIWDSTSCGPLFIPYPFFCNKAQSIHPAAITTVFLTDYGYLAIVLIASIPPQELYFFEDTIAYYGLPASEISAMHMSLGFAAKNYDLRRRFKCVTLGELIKKFNLYQEQSNGNKTNGLTTDKAVSP